MKKLVVLALAFISLNAFAQNNNKSEQRQKMKNLMEQMTPEEKANLKTKKMALHLDLSEKQQDQVYELLLVQAENREARKAKRQAQKESKKELTKDEFVKVQNEKLDRQIAFKNEMKNILDNDQYEKFEKAMARRSKNEKQRRTKKRQRQSQN